MVKRYPRPDTLSLIPRDRHAVIEASAGTGKTYTIEHLVVDLLLNTDCSLEELLVVTFTEKATSELRARIRSLIETILMTPEEGVDANEIEKDDHVWVIDIEGKRKLEQSLFSFDQASIFTIHGFCRRILVELAFESGQLFDQSRVEGATVFRRAWRELLREQIAVVPEYRTMLEKWLSECGSEDLLCTLLMKAYSKDYLEVEQTTDDELKQLVDELRTCFEPLPFVKEARRAAITSPAAKSLEEVLLQIETILDLEIPWSEVVEGLAQLNLKAVLSPRGTAARPDKPRYPSGLTQQSQSLLNCLSRIALLSEVRLSIERSVVDTFLPLVVQRMTAIKNREGLFDYDDLLRRVDDALRSDRSEPLIEVLQSRFRYGLIDEFQDTDPRQWSIFQRLFVQNSRGVLYVIGDPKQAIYGFRGADIHTYLDARKSLRELSTRSAELVPLVTNYRSSGELIEGVNRILDQAGSKPLFSGSIKYDEPVQCGRKTLRLEDADGEPVCPITLWHHVPPRRMTGRVQRSLAGWPLLRTYARQLAKTLSGLLNNPEEQLFLCEERDGVSRRRPLGAQDIYVLVRTGREAREAAAALASADIPYALFKQEGLFQSAEARAVRAILRAVENPNATDARLRAFASPFFGVDWNELGAYKNLASEHPYMLQLARWNGLAQTGDYATLFDALMTESVFLDRQLLLEDNVRTIALVEQVFETLLESAVSAHTSLGHIIEALSEWIDGISVPETSDGNILRLGDERAAVQIMTLHKSKGLEAPIICLFGGFFESISDPVAVLRSRNTHRVLVTPAARNAARPVLKTMEREEDERLLYVGLTRAGAKIFLPFIESASSLKGSYEVLNARLQEMHQGAEFEEPYFELLETPAVGFSGPHRAAESMQRDLSLNFESLTSSQIQSALKPEAPFDFQVLRRKNAPLMVTSYSRMKNLADARANAEDEKIDFQSDDAGHDPVSLLWNEGALPGGRHVGRFLHEVLEHLDFPFVGKSSFEEWLAESRVESLFMESMNRHGIDPKWHRVSAQIIYNSLTRAVTTKEGLQLPPLWSLKEQREMEFFFPIPENHHPLLLMPAPSTDWRVERGFIRGFIDLVFEHNGLFYWADWKSDTLPKYDAGSVEAHVGDHYEIQAQLYSIGLIRLLGIRDEKAYESRFGGFLYVFLRGLAGDETGQDGIYARRPRWEELSAAEHALLNTSLLPSRP